MRLKLLVRMSWRGLRGARGRAAIVVACIAVGVFAVVGVGTLVTATERAIRARSRELLGGDLALESRRPLPDLTALLPEPYRGVPRAAQTILSTMVRSARGESRLAELKAIDAQDGYPLAGELVLEPAGTFAATVDDGAVAVAPELMRELGLRRGDTLLIDNQPFRIAATIVSEPDPIALSLSLGPRVLMTRRALEKTSLLGFGHRTRHRALLALPAQSSERELAELKALLGERVPGAFTYVRIELAREAQPALRKALERVDGYVGLVTLLSLLVGSVGVARVVSAWVVQAAPQIAVLRCLGLTSRDVVALFVAQVSALALAGSVLGALLGAAAARLLATMHPTFLAAPEELAALPLVRGIALGVGSAVLFSFLPLASVHRIAPLRVLRRHTSTTPVPVLIAALGLAAAALQAGAYAQSGSLATASIFSAVVAAVALLSWLAAHALGAGVAKMPRDWLHPLVWHGMTALRRPSTTVSVVAVGSGALLLGSVMFAQQLLRGELQTALTVDAPNVYLIDVQPDQGPAIAALTRELGAAQVESVPVLMARLVELDGQPLAQLIEQRGGNPNQQDRRQWVLTREQRVSWMDTLPADNRIVAGALWSRSDVHELSIEESFARDLGAWVGTTLRFDVQGMAMDFLVTSIRSVRWRSFAPNFFLLAEPGALTDAPHFLFVALRIGAEREQLLQDRIAASYPNVSVLRVRPLLARAAAIMEQLALVVQLLAAFSLFAGLVVLVGAVLATEARRGREVALLKTLGLSRGDVLLMFAIEYALAGLLAGVLGAAGAYALARTVAGRVLDLQHAPSLGACAGLALATCALSLVVSLLASARALRVRPLAVLRG